MLKRLRGRRVEAQVPESSASFAGLDLSDYPGVESLLDAGSVSDAVDLMVRARPEMTGDERARAELQLRNEAFRRASSGDPADVPWPPQTEADLPVTSGLPEIRAEDLDRDRLVAGVRKHGVLIVRGLFGEDVCADLRSMIDQTMAAYDEDRERVDPAWNVPLTDVSGQVLGATHFRSWNHGAAGLAAADSPRAAAYILAEFQRVGLAELVGSYLGERPAISLEKWTLRRVPTDTGSSWHQDGAFLGTEKHTVNMWVALSDCGERASGLDIVARRFDHIVPTGTEGAFFDWDVSPEIVEQERGSEPIISPVFRAGDAVFFDQFLLHKTGTKPDLTEERYALETWFFTPTSFPGHYNGLLL